MSDACRPRFDAVLVWKIDRFGRSLKHLVNALAELAALGVAFISLRDNLDLSTPSGRLMFQIIGAMAEFERALIQERVRAGLRNARAKGRRLGRPRVIVDASRIALLHFRGFDSLREKANPPINLPQPPLAILISRRFHRGRRCWQPRHHLRHGWAFPGEQKPVLIFEALQPAPRYVVLAWRRGLVRSWFSRKAFPHLIVFPGRIHRLHWKRQSVSGIGGNHRSDLRKPVCRLLPDCRRYAH